MRCMREFRTLKQLSRQCCDHPFPFSPLTLHWPVRIDPTRIRILPCPGTRSACDPRTNCARTSSEDEWDMEQQRDRSRRLRERRRLIAARMSDTEMSDKQQRSECEPQNGARRHLQQCATSRVFLCSSDHGARMSTQFAFRFAFRFALDVLTQLRVGTLTERVDCVSNIVQRIGSTLRCSGGRVLLAERRHIDRSKLG